MIKIIGLVLVIVGGVLVFQGLSRKDSLLGQAAEAGTQVANKVDGGGRVANHFVKIGGGAVLILVGGALFFRKVG